MNETTPNMYRGIFTSDRADSAGDVIVDEGISIIPEIRVGDAFPVTADNTAGTILKMEPVTMEDGTKARRVYFTLHNGDSSIHPSPHPLAGFAPCVEAIGLKYEDRTDGGRTWTKCMITGLAVMDKPMNPDCDLEGLVDGEWRVITPPRTNPEDTAPKC